MPSTRLSPDHRGVGHMNETDPERPRGFHRPGTGFAPGPLGALP